MNRQAFSAWLTNYTSLTTNEIEAYLNILENWGNAQDNLLNINKLSQLARIIEQSVSKEQHQPMHYYYSYLGGHPITVGDTYTLPLLKPSGRKREYLQHPNLLKGRVIVEHLLHNRPHRWLDINVLGHNGNTKGRVSANLLYYFGMKADYRGIFEGETNEKLIELLEEAGEAYADANKMVKTYLSYLKKAEEEIAISDEELLADEESKEIERGIIKEGTVTYYHGNRYERSIANRKKAIAIHGVRCLGCGFLFEEKYGEHGKNYIEIHHVQPLHTLEEPEVIDPATDLVPLCANCHRMVHRKYDNVLSVQELQEIIDGVYKSI